MRGGGGGGGVRTGGGAARIDSTCVADCGSPPREWRHVSRSPPCAEAADGPSVGTRSTP
jgi:hypothetical protein